MKNEIISFSNNKILIKDSKISTIDAIKKKESNRLVTESLKRSNRTKKMLTKLEQILPGIDSKLFKEVEQIRSKSYIDTEYQIKIEKLELIIKEKEDLIRNYETQLLKVNNENTDLTSKVKILENEIKKQNTILETIINSQFSKLVTVKHGHQLNMENLSKIKNLEKQLFKEKNKHKTLDQLKKMEIDKNRNLNQNSQKVTIDSYNYKNEKVKESQYYNNMKDTTLNKTYDNSYSLINLVHGSTSLLYYTKDMIENLLKSENLKFLLNIFSDFKNFNCENDKDRVFLLVKSLLNDFVSSINLISKMKQLIDHQSIYVEKNLLLDVVIKSEKAASAICNSSDSLIFLLNYSSKEIVCHIENKRISFGYDFPLFEYILMSKKNINIKDTRLDLNFSLEEFSQKLGYIKIMNMLLTPILKDDKFIGILVNFNKIIENESFNHFDSNDELIINLYSDQLAYKLVSSLSYSEHMSHYLKISKLLSKIEEIHSQRNIKDLLTVFISLKKSIFLTEKAQIFMIKDASKGLYYKYDNFFGELTILNEGIVGSVLTSRTFNYTKKPWLHTSFNVNIDLNSSLPLATMPLFYKDSIIPIGILQFEYTTLPKYFSLEDKVDINSLEGINKYDSDVMQLLISNLMISIEKFYSFSLHATIKFKL